MRRPASRRRRRRTRRVPDRETDAILRLVAATVLRLRTASRWTQHQLGHRADVAQSEVSDVEHARLPDLPIGTAVRLLTALGAQTTLMIQSPFMAEPRPQRDPAHARLTAFVARRLTACGWLVRTEVEIVSPRARGWIDILAFHPGTRRLLVIECKTELPDIGAIERQLGWYEREAPAIASRLGWRPTSVLGCLIVLDTISNSDRVRANRVTFDLDFAVRAAALLRVVNAEDVKLRARPGAPLRGLAMADPRSRRSNWLVHTSLDGRRSTPRYLDYADFIRQRTGGRGRSSDRRPPRIEHFDTDRAEPQG